MKVFESNFSTMLSLILSCFKFGQSQKESAGMFRILLNAKLMIRRLCRLCLWTRVRADRIIIRCVKFGKMLLNPRGSSNNNWWSQITVSISRRGFLSSKIEFIDFTWMLFSVNDRCWMLQVFPLPFRLQKKQFNQIVITEIELKFTL